MTATTHRPWILTNTDDGKDLVELPPGRHRLEEIPHPSGDPSLPPWWATALDGKTIGKNREEWMHWSNAKFQKTEFFIELLM